MLSSIIIPLTFLICGCLGQDKWIDVEVLNSTCDVNRNNCKNYYIQICSTPTLKLSDCSRYNPINPGDECLKEKEPRDQLYLEMKFGVGNKHSYEYKNAFLKNDQFYIRIFNTNAGKPPVATICQTNKTGENFTASSTGFGSSYMITFRLAEIISTTSVPTPNILLTTDSSASKVQHRTLSTLLTSTSTGSVSNETAPENITDTQFCLSTGLMVVMIIVTAILFIAVIVEFIVICILYKSSACFSCNQIGLVNPLPPQETDGTSEPFSPLSEMKNQQKGTKSKSEQHTTSNKEHLEQSKSLISGQSTSRNSVQDKSSKSVQPNDSTCQQMPGPLLMNQPSMNSETKPELESYGNRPLGQSTNQDIKKHLDNAPSYFERDTTNSKLASSLLIKDPSTDNNLPFHGKQNDTSPEVKLIIINGSPPDNDEAAVMKDPTKDKPKRARKEYFAKKAERYRRRTKNVSEELKESDEKLRKEEENKKKLEQTLLDRINQSTDIERQYNEPQIDEESTLKKLENSDEALWKEREIRKKHEDTLRDLYRKSTEKRRKYNERHEKGDD